MKHIVSIHQFSEADKQKVFSRSQKFQNSPSWAIPQPLRGRVIATLFYESSTRTRLSFESAILRLGGSVLSTDNAGEVLSAIKGESLEDTIKIVGGYADAIVLRHYEAGAAARAAKVSNVPIINAGDGTGEHPTQALLDLYTLLQHKPNLDGVVIGVAGDLLGSRTLHSFLMILKTFPVRFRLIAPPGFELPEEYRTMLDGAGINYQADSDILRHLPDLDVLYINRWQTERYKDVPDPPKGPALTVADLRVMKPDAIIMNPLPRISELDTAIDEDPRAIYFEQAKNGLYVRMALLSELFD